MLPETSTLKTSGVIDHNEKTTSKMTEVDNLLVSRRLTRSTSSLRSAPTQGLDLSRRILIGYTWRSPNSCFWDVILEILFRAFHALSLPLQRSLGTDVIIPVSGPKNQRKRYGTLATLVLHFQARSKWIEGSTKKYKDERQGLEELKAMQGKFKDMIEKKWIIGEKSDPNDPNSSVYGTPDGVLGRIFVVCLQQPAVIRFSMSFPTLLSSIVCPVKHCRCSSRNPTSS